MFVNVGTETYLNIDNIEHMTVEHNRGIVQDGHFVKSEKPVLVIRFVSGEVFEYWKDDYLDIMDRIIRTERRNRQ